MPTRAPKIVVPSYNSIKSWLGHFQRSDLRQLDGGLNDFVLAINSNNGPCQGPMPQETVCQTKNGLNQFQKFAFPLDRNIKTRKNNKKKKNSISTTFCFFSTWQNITRGRINIEKEKKRKKKKEEPHTPKPKTLRLSPQTATTLWKCSRSTQFLAVWIFEDLAPSKPSEKGKWDKSQEGKSYIVAGYLYPC